VVRLLIILFLILATTASKLPVDIIQELPEFNHCTCDSATYCLDDSDVMKLHMWYDSIQHSLGRK
jgi:hypothetical protein